MWSVNRKNMENVTVKIDVTMYRVWLCRTEMCICEERYVTVCKEILLCREIVKKERLLKMKYKRRLPSGKHALVPFIVAMREHLFSYLLSDTKFGHMMEKKFS